MNANIKKVLKKRRYAGCQLSAMHGWQIVDYGKDGYGQDVIARSIRSEAEAWRNAAKRLYR